MVLKTNRRARSRAQLQPEVKEGQMSAGLRDVKVTVMLVHVERLCAVCSGGIGNSRDAFVCVCVCVSWVLSVSLWP